MNDKQNNKLPHFYIAEIKKNNIINNNICIKSYYALQIILVLFGFGSGSGTQLFHLKALVPVPAF